MPTDSLRRAIQVRLPSPAPHFPASVALGLALPAAALGVVLMGIDLHLLGLLVWTAAIVMLAFALPLMAAIGAVAALALAGALMWRWLLGAAAMLSHTEQVALALLTALATVAGQLVAREWRQREAIDTDRLQLDIFTKTIESIFAASGDCIKLLAVDGTVLAINGCGLKLVGADNTEQMIGRNWFALWGAEHQRELAASWQTALAQGLAHFDGSCRILTGERRSWHNTFAKVTAGHDRQTYIICVSSDITDNLTLQQTLKTNVAQLAGLLDSIDDGSFALDNNWIVTFCNQRGEALSAQMGCADAAGRNFWEIFPIKSSDAAAVAIRRAMEHKTAQRCEYFHAERGIWLGITTFPFGGGINILARDITPFKETQKIVAEENARLQVAQDIAGFGDWSFDYDHGGMRFSPRAVAMLELDDCAPHEYKQKLLEKLDARDRMALVQAIINSTESAPGIDLVVRIRARDGSERHLHWIGRLLTDERGQATRMLGAVQDVSAHLSVQRELEKARSLVRDLVDVLPQQVIVVDGEGRYVLTNEAWIRTRGDHAQRDVASADNLFEIDARRQTGGPAMIELTQRVARDILGGKVAHFEHEYEVEIDSAPHHFLMQALPLHTGGERLAVFVHSDVSTVKHLMHSVAVKDDLTRLPNRKALLEKLAQMTAAAPHFALLLLNLDRFKNINDTLGHGGGDQLLKLAAERLRAALPDEVFVARAGGDEFAIVCDSAHSQAIIDATLGCFVETFPLAGEPTFVTASLGVALCPDDSRDIGDLMRFAGAALRRAKTAGRNNCQWFKSTMMLPSRERLALENELHIALQRGEFELFYQGKFDLDSGALLGAEALLRWRSPTRGLVSPADFIPLLEETGLILPAGEWILKEACDQVRRWYASSGVWLPVAVNVSVLQIASRTFADKAIAILRESALPQHTIELEITESALMTDTVYGAQLIQTLKAAGFTIALDDFGTGYSSLGYLRKFLPSTLKIDRSFIADLTAESNDREIVAGIVQLAKALRINVVAEGIELAEQRNILGELGCVCGQGFLFGRPLPAAQFEHGVLSLSLAERFDRDPPAARAVH